MRVNRAKRIILVMLIFMAVWQTSKLWLGDVPSLNFLVKENNFDLVAIEPRSIWINPGAPSSIIYRLGEENREHQSVKKEIEKNLKLYTKEAKSSEIKKLDWEEILSKKGILYEYPINISYLEMIGDPSQSIPKKLQITEDIDYIFIPLSEDDRQSAKWYIISSENDIYTILDVQGNFENMRAFNDLLKEDTVSYKVKYQPTFNMSGVNKSSLFLPISGKDIPIKYDVLTWDIPLKDIEDDTKFNPYINHYFLNPLLKKEEIIDGDTYVFSELMKSVVKYYPTGVFEYSNIAVDHSKAKVSRLEAYNIARDFIDKNESLKKDIRKRLFLAKIIETEKGYTLYFDVRVKGVPVYFSKETRKKLKMDHMVQISIVGNEVSNFKWNSCEITPKKSGYKIESENFDMKYTEGLNIVLEHIANKGDFNSLAIDDMRWVYMLQDNSHDIQIRWIVQHEDEWYSP